MEAVNHGRTMTFISQALGEPPAPTITVESTGNFATQYTEALMWLLLHKNVVRLFNENGTPIDVLK